MLGLRKEPMPTPRRRLINRMTAPRHAKKTFCKFHARRVADLAAPETKGAKRVWTDRGRLSFIIANTLGPAYRHF